MQKGAEGLDIGIIMDGNGRWAKERGVPVTVGHRKGAEVFTDIVKHCVTRQVNSVTFYAFSTENWKRSKQEVEGLFKLFKTYLDRSLEYEKENHRVCFLGERDGLPQDIVKHMDNIQKKSAANTGLKLNIALNYGGRREIVSGVQKLCRQVVAGELSVEDIDEQAIGKSLYLSDLPDVDLVIRPSGEQRLSNFLIWQSAYAEFVSMDVLWPDFTSEQFDIAIDKYHNRNRRFGGR